MMMFCGYHLVVDPEIPEVLRIGPRFMAVTAEEAHGATLNDQEVIRVLVERIQKYERSRAH